MVNTSSFDAVNGGQLVTTTSGQGQAGDIVIHATDRMTISGIDPNYTTRIAKFPTPTIDSVVANDIKESDGRSGLFASASSTGEAGSVMINTPELLAQNGAYVTVSSVGQGRGGNIDIQANILTLDQGQISASTSSPANGGNITLNLQDSLRLRHNSLISASAGKPQSAGNGGNITINAPFIISFPSNNDIIANAFNGSGGQIEINAIRFGINPLSRAELQRLSPDLDPRKVPTSDITAFSLQNPSLSGTVAINSPDVDPSRGLIELPVNVVDPTTLIAQNPCQQGAGSAFIVTGRGGLPRNPNEALSSNNVQVDLVEPVSTSTHSPSATIKPLPTKPTVKRIVPAQGWVFNDKGEVVLTAYDPLGTGSKRTSKAPVACPAF